jgi:hypothetical protein
MQKHPLVGLHSRILHSPEDNHNNFDSIGWDQPDPVPNPTPEIITEKLRHKYPSPCKENTVLLYTYETQ